MASHVVVAVLDRKILTFAYPMFVTHVGTALRGFTDQVNNSERGNMLHDHPEDFELYELGTYDDQTGKFVLHEEPRRIAMASDCVKTGH